MGRAALFSLPFNLRLAQPPSARPTASSSRGRDPYASPSALVHFSLPLQPVLPGLKKKPVTQGLAAAATLAAITLVPHITRSEPLP